MKYFIEYDNWLDKWAVFTKGYGFLVYAKTKPEALKLQKHMEKNNE